LLDTYDVVLDTSAWTDFLSGGPAVGAIEALLASRRVGTCVISVAELADIYHRQGRVREWREDVELVEDASDILPIRVPVAAQAGALKVRQRKVAPSFGLIDAVIWETARFHHATLLTGDQGFRGLAGVEMLPR
jgi:predicted nucleic acid-binding protein